MTKEEEKKLLGRQVMDPNAFPSKVPLALNLQGWIVYHTAGYGYSEAIYDSDKILDAYEKAAETFPADMFFDLGGFSSMFFSRCLGSQDYFLNEEKYCISFKDVAYLESKDDYLLMAKDPAGYLWNNFYRNKFKNLSPDKVKETIQVYFTNMMSHMEKGEAVKRRVAEKHGTLFLADNPMYQPAFDYLFQYIIGMKTISMDMRRNKDALLAALNSMEDLFVRYLKELLPPSGQDMPFQMSFCSLGHTIANPKQFNTFTRPHMEKIIDWFEQDNLKFWFWVQGAAGPLLDFLDYIPAGLCAMYMERDTIEDMKARYGNKFAYMSGIPVSLLGNGTMDECRKYTLDFLEKHGHDGNLIFTTDKMVNYECDATVDNLRTVCDVVNNFKP